MSSTTNKDNNDTMMNSSSIIQQPPSTENNGSQDGGNNDSRRKSLFDYEDFSHFLDDLYKEKMSMESFTYYNLWTKHYMEANSLSECQQNFQNALREAGTQGGLDKLKQSVPKYWRSSSGATDLAMFFQFRPGHTTFESVKDSEKMKSVDPIMDIWTGSDSSTGQQKTNGPSSQLKNDNNNGESLSASRMDVKFKGRDASRQGVQSSSSSKSKNSKNRMYVEPTDDDVLFGRGGRSNKHPGNARYRREVERLEKGYKAGTKSEKRRIIEELIQAVQSRGNFLEKDKQHGWYVVDGDAIRKKVWQALREDRDPEKRRAKRKRFLAKKERMQNAKAQSKTTNIRVTTR